MAFTAMTLAQIEASIVDSAPQAFYETTTKRSMLFKRLRRVPITSPKGPQWSHKTAANAQHGSFVDGDDLRAPGAATKTPAQLGWGNYEGSFQLTHKQVLMLTKDPSKQLIGSEVTMQLEDLINGIIDDIETDIKSGATDDKTIIGISSAIDDGNIYAGIDRSTVTTFRSYVKDNAGGGNIAVTQVLLDDVWFTLTDTYGGRATVAFCNQSLWNSIAALSGNVESQVVLNKAEAVAEGVSAFVGVTRLFYRGIPVVAVPGYTANRIDFIDEDMLAIEMLEDITVKQETRGNLYYWTVYFYLQLRLHNPKMSAASLQEVS